MRVARQRANEMAEGEDIEDCEDGGKAVGKRREGGEREKEMEGGSERSESNAVHDNLWSNLQSEKNYVSSPVSPRYRQWFMPAHYNALAQRRWGAWWQEGRGMTMFTSFYPLLKGRGVAIA